jgi:hypothetical protein
MNTGSHDSMSQMESNATAPICKCTMSNTSCKNGNTNATLQGKKFEQSCECKK